MRAVNGERLHERIGRELRCERIRQPKHTGELGPELARAQNPQRNSHSPSNLIRPPWSVACAMPPMDESDPIGRSKRGLRDAGRPA